MTKQLNPMPTGERRIGPASLRVRRCTALPEHLRAKTREIVDVETLFAEQGKGYATTLMHKVCREADAAGLVLVLSPQPYGDNINLSKQQLTEWYERSFGFAIIQHEPVTLMARMPGATPRMLQLNPITEAMQKEKTK
jgi:GNAT superfamily N-acetyltransferase